MAGWRVWKGRQRGKERGGCRWGGRRERERERDQREGTALRISIAILLFQERSSFRHLSLSLYLSLPSPPSLSSSRSSHQPSQQLPSASHGKPPPRPTRTKHCFLLRIPKPDNGTNSSKPATYPTFHTINAHIHPPTHPSEANLRATSHHSLYPTPTIHRWCQGGGRFLAAWNGWNEQRYWSLSERRWSNDDDDDDDDDNNNNIIMVMTLS